MSIDALYDPDDGMIDLGRLSVVRRLLALFSLAALAVGGLTMVFVSISYIGSPIARMLDLNIRYIYEAIITATVILSVQFFLIAPFEIAVWARGFSKGYTNNHLNRPFRRLRSRAGWKSFAKSFAQIFVIATVIKESLFLIFGRPVVEMLDGEAYYAYQGGWLATILFFVLMIAAFIYVPRIMGKLRSLRMAG